MIPGPHLEYWNDACYREIQPTIRSYLSKVSREVGWKIPGIQASLQAKTMLQIMFYQVCQKLLNGGALCAPFFLEYMCTLAHM